MLLAKSIECVHVTSSNSQIQNKRATKGFIASGAGDFSCKWSRYNLCDIVTKASVAFVVSTDPDVHFKCCISADSKVQASIQACRVHSGALDELTAQ